jgi:26S proteasome non-ATPase regulatory subunit 9
MQREDLVVKFGGLRHPQSNLQALAAVVAENENVGSPVLFTTLEVDLLMVRSTLSQKAIGVLVRRSGTDGLIALRLIPRQGWGGRGSLGYVSWCALHAGRLTAIVDVTSCHMRRRNVYR